MRVAVAQTATGPDKSANLAEIAGFAARAAEGSAELLICPEAAMVTFEDDRARIRTEAEPLDGPFATSIRELSTETGLTIVVGMHEPSGSSDGRVYNTSIVASRGELIAHYRKLHLYDAFAMRESEDIIAADADPVTFRCGGLTVGLITCYDLRFPEIFRDLVDRGAQLFAVSAAWVRGSLKEDHWTTLLRARAVENTCYVAAAGQVNPKNIGRSAVFDPLGLQLTDLGEQPGVAVVEVTEQRLEHARAVLPSLAHRRYAVSRK
ncbi:carbon-nitrogen hydrolase family protein [Saccharopolyspora sp. ASAGF58]|uniref:carbon-nitrogen hydrolase family protein n=1 Tax=Saccharopolyspora sp. ASAGF58 TaxID=2719023 RepID=UPI00143FC84D|nr:carbon-nitrogen hydrolase family protein [Saccharopolyspora sp. ASAGF58]QIZ37419.1 carbon-nitrogen hydrolase family protein [Saccharopolyspora sp. ASAGF58]